MLILAILTEALELNHKILRGKRNLSLTATGKPKPWPWGEKISVHRDYILESGDFQRNYQGFVTTTSVLGSLWSNSLDSEGDKRMSMDKEGSGIRIVGIILKHRFPIWRVQTGLFLKVNKR